MGRKKKLGQHQAIDTLPFYQSNLSQLLLSGDKEEEEEEEEEEEDK